MDYYAKPKDLTLEQAQISQELDILLTMRKTLETLESKGWWHHTDQVETQYEAIEERIKFLRGLAKEIQHG